MRIDPVDPDTAAEAELDAWHEFCRHTDRFDLPGEPDPPRSATVGDLINDEDRRLSWFARSGDELVGGATLMLAAFENSHFGEFYARVRPGARRAGVGRALLDRARTAAREDNRTSLSIWAQADSPGSAFAATAGARLAQDEIRRVLHTAEVDPAAVTAWAGGAAARVDGFDLVRWVAHCPEELLEPYARARGGMNDAPRGEINWQSVILSGERIRVREDALIRRGARQYVVAVRERATGALAGITEVFASPDSVRADQGDTTVLGPYRGRGFGLWLKADMLRWLSGVEPHVAQYDTWNAAENAHMIAVNEQLGYRMVDTWQAWQLTFQRGDR